MIDNPLPHINCWADVQALIDNDALTPAEHAVIEAAKTGLVAEFGTAVPTARKDAVLVRAPLLRYLILGGCDECRTEAAGVHIEGAWIDGVLDLNFVKAAGPIGFWRCHIAEQPQMGQLALPRLEFNGSKLLKGLNAQGAQIGGDVFLREATTDGVVRLSGATITGQLDCAGAHLRNATDFALHVQGAQIGGGIFLDSVTTEGEVGLAGATITGQLSCEGAHLRNAKGTALHAQGAQIGGGVFLDSVTTEGEVGLVGATITGQLSCAGAHLRNANGTALHAQGLIVKGGFIWRGIKEITGVVDLTSAHVADLVDDAESWDNVDRLSLAGFTYDMLHGTVTIGQRLDWLKKGAVSHGDFHPQPYEQLAKVLRESGHRAEAVQIMIAKEIAQRAATRISLRDDRKRRGWANLRTRLRIGRNWATDRLLRGVVGYGYKPFRSVVTLACLIGFTAFMAFATWRAGDFAPNSGPILISEEWQAYARAAPNPAKAWSDNAVAGRDYETFNAIAYGADVVIPLVSFGQEAAWAPSTSRSWWGWNMLWLEWVLTLVGWIVTAIGAAAVTGVIRRD